MISTLDEYKYGGAVVNGRVDDLGQVTQGTSLGELRSERREGASSVKSPYEAVPATSADLSRERLVCHGDCAQVLHPPSGRGRRSLG